MITSTSRRVTSGGLHAHSHRVAIARSRPAADSSSPSTDLKRRRFLLDARRRRRRRAAAVAGALPAVAAAEPHRRRSRTRRRRLSRDRARPRLLPHGQALGGGRIMLLTKKSEGVAAAGPRLRRLAGSSLPTMDRRTFLKRSGLVAGAGAFASQLPYGAIGTAEARRRKARRQDRGQAHRLHALLGRLRGRRHRRERRVDAAGAGVRFAAQPRRALRQGRVGARARRTSESIG